MSSRTKDLLIAGGAILAAVIIYEVLFVPSPTTDDDTGLFSFQPTVLQSLSTDIKIGGAAATGLGIYWLGALLLA
jgi:hypothetical protein